MASKIWENYLHNLDLPCESSYLPKDRLSKQFVHIDQGAVVVLYTLTIFIAILTTIQLILQMLQIPQHIYYVPPARV